MGRQRLLLGIVFFSALFCNVAAASVGRVAVVIDSGGSDLEPLIRSSAEATVQRLGGFPIDLAELSARVQTPSAVVRCDSDGCRARLLAGIDADSVLLLRVRDVRVGNGAPLLELAGWVVNQSDGSVRSVAETRCEHCSAVVRIDATIVDLSGQLLREAASRSGAVTATAEVPAAATTSVPTVAVPTPKRRSTWKRPARWTLLAVGAAALVTGAVLIVKDPGGPPYYDERGAQLPSKTRTKTAGIAACALGALSLGAGAYLWITDDSEVVMPNSQARTTFGLGYRGLF